MNEYEYLKGRELIGDDFGEFEINQWFREEEEAYANLGAKLRSSYIYSYHALNYKHGYKYIKDNKQFENVLGLGSAYGNEFIPIISKLQNLFIIDSSLQLKNESIAGKRIVYLKPNSNGKINFKNETFDLITCFGVLHHIPNVSFVFHELTRVLKKDGILLLREPIVTMGDWRKPRVGLTKNERGIPKNILYSLIQKNNLYVIKKTFCFFPITDRITKILKIPKMNNDFVVLMDKIFATIFSWNYHYHPISFFSKFQAQAIFFVLQKK